ncbi:MAG: hypothetical protein FJ116_01285 [Deltaproteobacteria bacterium]|nr:hypothetical protein [Deltaproteobacteria bacterium]MBM4316096.1 hypothetical protein [Deltaproteobacteria bacterium]
MKKPDLNEILKKTKDLKSKASQLTQEAGKAASMVKDAVSIGVSSSKNVMEKAKEIVTPERISQGLEATSKGMEMAAKGAKQLANSIDKASKEVRKLGSKIKPKS